MGAVQGFPANRWPNKMGVMLSLGPQLIIQLLYQIPRMFRCLIRGFFCAKLQL